MSSPDSTATPVDRHVIRPLGFVATCRCGVITGAMDFERTNRKDAGTILGRWLFDGCTVEPRFESGWCVFVEPCKCV